MRLAFWRRKPKSNDRRPVQPIVRGRIENYLPPEGVPLNFQVASLGIRFGAQFLDVLITTLVITALVLLFSFVVVLPWSAFFALIALLVFLARIPYYIITELIWNGRTLGKRITRIRVISADGRRLTPHQIAARNLMKEVEFFTPVGLLFAAPNMSLTMGLILSVWLLIIILFPFFNRRRQRLGDVIAGTYVIETPKTLLLGDLATSRAAVAQIFVFLPMHLEFYGRYELQTLEAILRDDRVNTTARNVAIDKVVQNIITKIGYTDPVKPGQHSDFLFAFYRAQREYLESRKLFGDAREDKFHKTYPRDGTNG